MKMVAVFLVFFFLPSTVHGAAETRILGGSETPQGMYEFLPAMITIAATESKGDLMMCSSTIISARHVLTAGHCLLGDGAVNITMKDMLVKRIIRIRGIFMDYRPMEKLGSELGIRLKHYAIAPKVYVHPSFSMVHLFSNDIAIIEFPEGTDFKIPPINLASDYQETASSTAIAAGYGVYKIKTNYKGEPETQSPGVLQNANVDIFTADQCPDTKQYGATDFFSQVICTGTPTRRAFKGDSGGPLFVKRGDKFYQIGITSAAVNENSFYTRISSQCDWIAKTTKNESQCVPLPPLSEFNINGADDVISINISYFFLLTFLAFLF